MNNFKMVITSVIMAFTLYQSNSAMNNILDPNLSGPSSQSGERRTEPVTGSEFTENDQPLKPKAALNKFLELIQQEHMDDDAILGLWRNHEDYFREHNVFDKALFIAIAQNRLGAVATLIGPIHANCNKSARDLSLNLGQYSDTLTAAQFAQERLRRYCYQAVLKDDHERKEQIIDTLKEIVNCLHPEDTDRAGDIMQERQENKDAAKRFFDLIQADSLNSDELLSLWRNHEDYFRAHNIPDRALFGAIANSRVDVVGTLIGPMHAVYNKSASDLGLNLGNYSQALTAAEFAQAKLLRNARKNVKPEQESKKERVVAALSEIVNLLHEQDTDLASEILQQQEQKKLTRLDKHKARDCQSGSSGSAPTVIIEEVPSISNAANVEPAAIPVVSPQQVVPNVTTVEPAEPQKLIETPNISPTQVVMLTVPKPEPVVAPVPTTPVQEAELRNSLLPNWTTMLQIGSAAAVVAGAVYYFASGEKPEAEEDREETKN